MPSFVCDKCQETLKKPKLDAHVQRCRGASFSCIDCYKHFVGTEYRNHFSCISEVEKYEKRKPTGGKSNGKQAQLQGDNHNQSNGSITSTDTNTAGGTKDEPSEETVAPVGKRAKTGKLGETPAKTKSQKLVKPTSAELIKEMLSSQGPMSLKSLLKALKRQHGLSKKSLLERMTLSCATSNDLILTLTG